MVNGTGGNWLTLGNYNPNGVSTPHAITLAAAPATNLAAGTYTAQVFITSFNRAEAMVIPVTLTVEPSSATYFDELPGELTYSSQPTGAAIASQRRCRTIALGGNHQYE